jgi:hypothetical protein
MVQTKTYCSTCGGVQTGKIDKNSTNVEWLCACPTTTTFTTFLTDEWQLCPKCQGTYVFQVEGQLPCNICHDKGIISTRTGLPPSAGTTS